MFTLWIVPIMRGNNRSLSAGLCSQLLGLHRTAVLRHDEYGQETLLNLLMRNYLHYNLYDQVCCAPCCLPT